jgi:adenosinetriphosphatase
MSKEITRIIENFDTVPDSLKDKFNVELATGFPAWTATDYQKFYRAFMRHDIGDIDAIAKEIDSKTVEEVTAYFNVFMHRFRELKECD